MESPRNCHNSDESKETLWPSVMWYPGWDPGAKKTQTLGKNLGNLNKVWILIYDNVAILVQYI